MNPLRLLVWLGLLTSCLSATEPARFFITDHGAKADGTTVNTAAIQAAIEAATPAGGTVVIPAGTFLTGSVFLKTGVTLHLDAGAVLKGTINPADYPDIATRWEGVEREWIAALVNAIDADRAAITGEGTLDGSGEAWPSNRRRQPTAEAGGPAEGAANLIPRRGRPRFIVFQNCRDVRVAGIRLLNQSSWGLTFLYCTNARAENLLIRAEHHIPSSDGIDIDSSRNVLVTGCDIAVNDDCISIKSGKDEDGRRVNRPSEDILVEKTRFGYGHGGVAMGRETSGGIRRVEVRDGVFEDDNWAPVRFKSQPSRGGVVEDITYRNLTLRGTRQAVEFNLAWRMVPPGAPPAPVLPVVRRIRLINIIGTVTSAGLIAGLADSPISDVTFEGCMLTAQKPLVLPHTANIDLRGLTLTGVTGEPVVRR